MDFSVKKILSRKLWLPKRSMTPKKTRRDLFDPGKIDSFSGKMPKRTKVCDVKKKEIRGSNVRNRGFVLSGNILLKSFGKTSFVGHNLEHLLFEFWIFEMFHY